MTEENTEIVEAEQADAQEVETPDPYADEAQQFGWKPAENWHGEGHMSAEKYMTRGPGTSRKLEAKIAALEKGAGDYDKRLARMQGAQKAALDAQHKADMKRVKDGQRTAAETGDVAEFDKLAKEEEALTAEPAEENSEEAANAQLIGDWMAKNPAYDNRSPQHDPSYQKDIDALWNKAWSYGIRDTAILIAYVDDNYAAPKQRQAPGMDGGGSTGPIRGAGAKGWGAIPADDRKAAMPDIDSGLFDDLAKAGKMTAKEAFAIEYFKQ